MLTSGPPHGLKNIFGTTRQGRRDAVRGRRGRRGARLSGRRRSDHHLHRVSGPAADDPQYVQDRWRAAARRVPCLRAYRRHPRAEHLRRPFRRHGLPPDRLCHALRGQRAGGHGPRRRGPSGRHQGHASPSSTSSTASAPPTRSRRSPSGTTRTWPTWCDMDAVEAFRQHAPEPRASPYARLPRERRYLLPAP